MFQTYTDQTGSFECEERDQQSQNNEECLEDKVQSKFLTKISIHVCEIQHSMLHGIHCFYCIPVYLMYFVLYS